MKPVGHFDYQPKRKRVRFSLFSSKAFTLLYILQPFQFPFRPTSNSSHWYASYITLGSIRWQIAYSPYKMLLSYFIQKPLNVWLASFIGQTLATRMILNFSSLISQEAN